MNTVLTDDHVGFAVTASRIGDLLASPAGVNPEDATIAAQWLLPLPKGVSFPPERAEGLQFAAHYDVKIRALAAAALRCPEVLELVTQWNAITTPREEPLRYLTRWTTTPAT